MFGEFFFTSKLIINVYNGTGARTWVPQTSNTELNQLRLAVMAF